MLHEIVAPVSRRLGTMLGSALTSWGVSAEHVGQVEAFVPVLVGVAVDVVLSSINRKKLIRGVLR